MRATLASLLAVGLLCFGAPVKEADAGVVKVVSGGPSGGERRAAVQAFDRLRTGALSVCWRRPVVVRVQLSVAASGVVKKAVHKSGASVGQCVAGVLAVQTLPRTKRGYRVVLDLPSASSTKRVASSITEDLVAVRPALQSCYDRAKATKAGDVVLRFLIKPSGRIVDPSVQRSTIANRPVEACMLRELAKASLRGAPGSKTVAYSLSLSLRPGGSAPASVGAGSSKHAPKKDGPIPAAVLTGVMKQEMEGFRACARHAKKPLSGTAIVRFTIGANGTTRNVKIKSSDLRAKKVESCLVANAKKLRFPAEEGRAKTRVFYPFTFRQ